MTLLNDVLNSEPSKGAQYTEFAGLMASLVLTVHPDTVTAATEPELSVDPEVRTLRTALAAERNKRRELEHQVEALRRLEDNLNQRDKRQE